MSDYIRKSVLLEQFFEDTPHCQYVGVKYVDDLIKNQQTLDEKEIIRKPFYRVVRQLNEQMPIKFNGFGKTLIAVEDVIKILKEECGINE